MPGGATECELLLPGGATECELVLPGDEPLSVNSCCQVTNTVDVLEQEKDSMEFELCVLKTSDAHYYEKNLRTADELRTLRRELAETRLQHRAEEEQRRRLADTVRELRARLGDGEQQRRLVEECGEHEHHLAAQSGEQKRHQAVTAQEQAERDSLEEHLEEVAENEEIKQEKEGSKGTPDPVFKKLAEEAKQQRNELGLQEPNCGHRVLEPKVAERVRLWETRSACASRVAPGDRRPWRRKPLRGVRSEETAQQVMWRERPLFLFAGAPGRGIPSLTELHTSLKNHVNYRGARSPLSCCKMSFTWILRCVCT